METFLFKQNLSWGGMVDNTAKGEVRDTSGDDAATAQLIVLDGSHNGDSLRVFLQSLQEKYPSHQRLIIFGAGMEKSVDVMMEELFRHADRIVFVQSQHFKSYTEAQLLTRIPTYVKATGEKDALTETDIGKKLVYMPQLVNTAGGTVANRLVHCVRMIRNNAAQPTVIGVCGSLFVASDAREALFRLDPSLFGENDWVRFADPPLT
jgi:folylpolyglutamate synthase/dihydropteroate synthase